MENNEIVVYDKQGNVINCNFSRVDLTTPASILSYGSEAIEAIGDVLDSTAQMAIETDQEIVDNKKIDSSDYSYHKNIWIDTMEAYFKDHDSSWYNIPDNVVGVLVNPITGIIANENDTKKEMFFYLKGTEPTLQTVSKDLDAVFKEDTTIIENE